MTVRVANFADIPAIVAIGADAHKRSIYGPISTYDPEMGKQLCARSIQRHGHHNYGGTLVLVSEIDDAVRGFIIAILDQVYPCVEELMVTDLFFVGDDDMDPRDAITMIKKVIAWGEANPKVIEMHMGVTDAITGEAWTRVGQIYEHLGLVQCGAMYRMIFDRTLQEAAKCL